MRGRTRDVWSRRMLVIQALNSCNLRRSGSTLRSLQQRSGSRVQSASPCVNSWVSGESSEYTFSIADSVFLFDPVHQVVGFGKEEFGINGEETEIFSYARCHVDQDHALGAECGGDGDVAAETSRRPTSGLAAETTSASACTSAIWVAGSNAHAITSSDLSWNVASEEMTGQVVARAGRSSVQVRQTHDVADDQQRWRCQMRRRLGRKIRDGGAMSLLVRSAGARNNGAGRLTGQLCGPQLRAQRGYSLCPGM